MVDFAKLQDAPELVDAGDGSKVWRTPKSHQDLGAGPPSKHTMCGWCDGRGWDWISSDETETGWKVMDCRACIGRLAQGNDDIFEEID